MSEARLAASLDGPDGAPVLVLANPIGTTRAIWAAQVPVLQRHFRLLRFELRGHGEPGARSAAPPGPYSIAELGTDVLGLMRDHGVTTAAYCGISIGGMIGLWLAANAPERISSLVVCCAAITPMPSRQAWLDRAALVRSAGMAAISEMTRRAGSPRTSSRASPRPSRRSWTCCSAPIPRGYAGCAEAIADLDLVPWLPRSARSRRRRWSWRARRTRPRRPGRGRGPPSASPTPG